ncbi:unnamed protein product [Adineta ricciae]|uniref:G-protein coupled receptors family 1 profile domain-containing protein n=1 Tax=Adineta ricciae TaxID=249248 RepID=A0A816B6E8_ADIRI|nr:unnamed protein product [Adineta ricciae]CAF1606183.1 unnamed protein product [Adineta ricciae]
MANEMNSTFVDEEALAYQQLPITFSIRFWIYLISNVLSLPFCFFILFHLLFNRNLRETLSNHIIIVLLLLVLAMECIYFPLAVHYYRLGGNWHVPRPFSQLWTYSLFGLFPTQTVVFAWCTIERHILIFHNHLLATKANRILVHYVPLVVVPVYCLTYYGLNIFIPFHSICRYLDVQSTVIGVYLPCFFFNPIHLKIDVIIHQIIPILIIITSTLALFFRFQRQRVHRRRSMQWKKQRKLIIQVLSIVTVFGVFQFPWALLESWNLFGIPFGSLGVIQNYMLFFNCYSVHLFPLVCIGTIPEISKKMAKLLWWKRPYVQVYPLTLSLNRN